MLRRYAVTPLRRHHLTALSHLSHTARISIGQLWLGWVSSWASLPVQPGRMCSGSASDWRCACLLLRHVLTRIWNNFSSRIYHLLFTIYWFLALRRCSGEQARSPIYHLPFTVFVIVNVIVFVYYYTKIQNFHELCKKNTDKITMNHAISRQKKTNQAISRQNAPTAHQFFVPLSRVRKRKSTSWKSGVDTLKSTIRHFAQARRANERENDL